MGKSRNQLLAALFASVLLLVALSSSEAKSKKPKQVLRGTPILWRAPTNISTRNLFLGPGGSAMKPDLRRVKFIKEEKGGYSKKFRIEDGAGREWVAKVGNEAQPETAAVRLVWATGYETEVNYLVPRMTIPGKGTFENVRLEARPKNVKRLDEWKWKQNPFVGSQELQGLKVLMLLLSNWDIKDSNNQILSVKGTDQLHFIISDLGATFGKTGSLPLFWRFTRSRNKPEDYQKASFVTDVDEGFVDFHYGGRQREIFDDITVDQARWIGNWLGRLRPEQIKDAFRAANYDREDQAILTRSVLRRIDQLRALSRQPERDVETSKSDHSLRRE
ncbi:MAG TPA: hypothetical protein VGO56_17615 [Pyrinomonadaceae bacterium]|jgi:hypothetical protein|nr:hypothetical protein [Pyrinomonadaceae bacterium]